MFVHGDIMKLKKSSKEINYSFEKRMQAKNYCGNYNKFIRINNEKVVQSFFQIKCCQFTFHLPFSTHSLSEEKENFFVFLKLKRVDCVHLFYYSVYITQ